MFFLSHSTRHLAAANTLPTVEITVKLQCPDLLEEFASTLDGLRLRINHGASEERPQKN